MNIEQFLGMIWDGYVGTVHTPRHRTGQDGSWAEHPHAYTDDGQILLAIAHSVSVDIDNGYDVYFSPVVFDGTRTEARATGSNWAWSDLDAVDPRDIVPRPTIAWESSPGRYQALWAVGSTTATTASHLSKQLAYTLGADKGCWNVSRVLRIPGSINHKYPGKPTVTLLWADGPVYTSQTLTEHLQEVPDEATPAKTIPEQEEGRSATELLYSYQVSPRAESLLSSSAQEVKKSDRSRRIFELMCHLAEAGMTATEIATVAKSSPWNKFKGRQREWEILVKEARKALAKISPTPKKLDNLHVTWLPDLLSVPDAGSGWLIKDWWLSDSWGIMSGEAKSFKSLITMEMAVSVSSGIPLFKGKNYEGLEVHTTGPVLVIQEENDHRHLQDAMVDILQARGRLERDPIQVDGTIWTLHGMEPLSIAFLNQTGMDITSLERREHIEQLISEIEPVLVIFDPFYRMTPSVDHNQAHEVEPQLKWLTNLSVKYKTSVCLVDHQRKNQGKNDSTRSGQRLGGSHVKHDWIMSGLFINRPSDAENTIWVERQFRRSGGQGILQLTPQFDPTYDIIVG